MIGLAGCGRMGAPMLSAMRAAGIEAIGFDILPPDHFGELGDIITDDPDIFAKDLTTLLSVVRDIDQTEDVLFGAQAFVDRARLDRIIICSTLSPRYVKGLRDRVPAHISLIDAPMSGARIAAAEARLSFMLGGATSDLDAAQPLLETMGKYFYRTGPFGSGMQAKVLNNLLAASSTAMTRLVLDWAEKLDLDEVQLREIIATSSGQNWFASEFDRIEFAYDGFAPDNTIGTLMKDIDSALDAAPPGADTTLPRQVRTALSGLRPKTG